MKIALDVDEVLANFADPVHEAAERVLGRYLPCPEVWEKYDLAEAMGLSLEESNLLHATLCEEDNLGWKIDLFPGAQDFVLELFARGHDVFFVTAPWPGIKSWVHTRTNLLEHFFGESCFDTVFTKAKHRCAFDVIVDDNPEVLRAVGARGIVFDNLWNQTVPGRRAFSFEHCLEVIASIEGKK